MLDVVSASLGKIPDVGGDVLLGIGRFVTEVSTVTNLNGTITVVDYDATLYMVEVCP